MSATFVMALISDYMGLDDITEHSCFLAHACFPRPQPPSWKLEECVAYLQQEDVWVIVVLDLMKRRTGAVCLVVVHPPDQEASSAARQMATACGTVSRGRQGIDSLAVELQLGFLRRGPHQEDPLDASTAAFLEVPEQD